MRLTWSQFLRAAKTSAQRSGQSTVELTTARHSLTCDQWSEETECVPRSLRLVLAPVPSLDLASGVYRLWLVAEDWSVVVVEHARLLSGGILPPRKHVNAGQVGFRVPWAAPGSEML